MLWRLKASEFIDCVTPVPGLRPQRAILTMIAGLKPTQARLLLLTGLSPLRASIKFGNWALSSQRKSSVTTIVICQKLCWTRPFYVFNRYTKAVWMFPFSCSFMTVTLSPGRPEPGSSSIHGAVPVAMWCPVAQGTGRWRTIFHSLGTSQRPRPSTSCPQLLRQLSPTRVLLWRGGGDRRGVLGWLPSSRPTVRSVVYTKFDNLQASICLGFVTFNSPHLRVTNFVTIYN